MSKTLYDKLWSSHVVHVPKDDGTTLLYIDRHLVHEVTSPQAFEGLRLAGRKPWRIVHRRHGRPQRADRWHRREVGILDPVSRQQVETLDANIRETGALAYFPLQGQAAGHRPCDRPGKRCHAAGHDRGLRRFAYLDARRLRLSGARHRHLGSRARAGHAVPAAEEIEDHADRVEGKAGPGVTREGHRAGPVIGQIGTAGGTGYAIEFGGSAIRALSMEGRMTVCNMAIEAGARAGMVCRRSTTPPSITCAGGQFRPRVNEWDKCRRLLAHAEVGRRRAA
jgi:3-isopropylmalate/(R)-2-methylmalate dehydratase large subunit